MREAGLFDLLTVHCFLTWSAAGCTFTVEGIDGQEVHDRMEEHYRTAHRAYLDAVTAAL